VAPLGGTGKTQFFGDGEKIAELPDFHRRIQKGITITLVIYWMLAAAHCPAASVTVAGRSAWRRGHALPLT
jgi:hypothetical protein